MVKFEDYLIPGTKVLKNRLGITDFMNDFKKKENQFFRIKLRGVFEIPKFHHVWIYVANASQYNYTSQQDMEEIFKKIK